MTHIDVDDIIHILKNSKGKMSARKVLKEKQICALIRMALAILKEQPVFLELVPPLTIVGDIHGQFRDLLRIFDKGGDPDTTNYLFLGDYVDRGDHSINCMCLLLAYKIKFPNNFFLLRGNHESRLTNRDYGFYDECTELYGERLWDMFNDMFNWLPITALIDCRILCIHGGISPDLRSINDLKKFRRPVEIPDEGLLCDLLWSDPDPTLSRKWAPSDRRTSYVFNQAALKECLNNLKLDLIIRAHQAIDTGYEFPFPERSIVTVFSAPDYGGMMNRGAIMHISKKMVCTFSVLPP